MQTYHKIQSIFYRDPDNNYKTFIEGKFSDSAFGYLQNVKWDFTEKIDGTNIRIGWNGNGVQFGGRNRNSQLPGQLRMYMEDYFTDALLSSVFQGAGSITLIGEGYGGKIQKMGKVYGDEQRFILFDVFVEPCENHPLGIWIERDSVQDIACQLGIPSVRIVMTCSLIDGYQLVKNCPHSLESFAAKEDGAMMEGLVGRPVVEMRNRFGSRIITKIKVKDFPVTDA